MWELRLLTTLWAPRPVAEIAFTPTKFSVAHFFHNFCFSFTLLLLLFPTLFLTVIHKTYDLILINRFSPTTHANEHCSGRG
jgi:hypothetical protein